MKASEIIEKLQQTVDTFGDFEVVFSHNKQTLVCKVTGVMGFIDKADDCEINSNFDEHLIVINGR